MKLIFIYRPVVGYEDKYSVSATGVLFDKLKNRFCKLYTDYRSGYIKVNLSDDWRTGSYNVHRIVAESWIPNPKNLPVVNHVNNIKSHNWIDNLEWSTQSNNCLDYWRRQRYFVDKIL